MLDDVLLLSRIQFAFTIMFHYLFPPLTIGLGIVLVYLDWMRMRTGAAVYDEAARFWTRIFALNFAIGVASGIVMEFQFGTNWAAYSRFVGDVFGSALAAEGIFAFFLESGFLAVLVFGWDRVGPRMHFFSTCMVALGSIFSSIWIVVANSWQQTPAGHHIVPVQRDGAPWIVDGEPVMRAEIVDFWAMVFNPSSVERLIHVWLGCFIMGAFFVLSVSAWYLLHGRHREFATRSFRGALVLGTVSSLAILVSGHFQARGVYQNQPAKLAAFEGHFETGRGDLTIFGVPDPAAGEIHYQVAIPGGLSFLLFDDFETPVLGLEAFAPEDRPSVWIPFAMWRVMVGLGLFFIALSLTGCLFWWRGTLLQQRWLLWTFVFSVLGAVAANQAGWIAAETGRQPWIVYPPLPLDAEGGLVLDASGYVAYDAGAGLRTREGVSPVLDAGQLRGSLAMFGAIYALLFAVWVFLLHQKIQHGPTPAQDVAHPHGGDEGFLGAAQARADHTAHLTDEEPEAEPGEART